MGHHKKHHKHREKHNDMMDLNQIDMSQIQNIMQNIDVNQLNSMLSNMSSNQSNNALPSQNNNVITVLYALKPFLPKHRAMIIDQIIESLSNIPF